MEKVFREISKSELTDAQKGQLLTMSLQYLDFDEITSDDCHIILVKNHTCHLH